MVIVDGIVDKGHYLGIPAGVARAQAAGQACAAACFSTSGAAREADLPVDYLGLPVPNRFVIGYGLDYQEITAIFRILRSFERVKRSNVNVNKHLRSIILIILAVVAVFIIVERFVAPSEGETRLDYGAFYQKLEAGQVQSFHATGLSAIGDLSNGTKYSVAVPNVDQPFVDEVYRQG